MNRRNPNAPSRAYKVTVEALDLFLSDKISVSGTESLPEKSEAYVLALTHHNSWDVPAAGYAIYQAQKRPVHFIGYEDFLDGSNVHLIRNLRSERAARLAGRLLTSMHALPVSREKATSEQLVSFNGVLRRGGVLGIFTEAARVNGELVGNIANGAGIIAMRNNVRVVPAAVAGRTYGEIGSRLALFPRSLHVHIGEAIEPYTAESSRKPIIELTQEIRQSQQQALDEATAQYIARYQEK